MEFLPQNCTQRSTGAANQLVGLLIQTLLSSYCSLSDEKQWPTNYGSIAVEKGLDPYDFVIVGAGTAGSVLANRLSENPAWKVLLLEAGGDPPIESEVPAWANSMQLTDNDWQFQTESDKKSCLGMRDLKCNWPRGRLLGGTSSINSMLYERGSKEVFDNWEKSGNSGWNWKSVLLYFLKMENFQAKDSETTFGKGGLVPIDRLYQTPEMQQLSKIIIQAGKKMDVGYKEEFKNKQDIGYTKAVSNTLDGRRYSIAKAHLHAAKKRENLHVIKNAHVTAVKFNAKKHATDITFLYNKTKELTVSAEKEIILSAGAVATPHILMLSGIGPEKSLRKHNISIVENLPVGKNLQDQLVIPMYFKLDKHISNPLTKEELLTDIYEFLIKQPSTLSIPDVLDVLGSIDSKDRKSVNIDVAFRHSFIRRQSPTFYFGLTSHGYNDGIKLQLMEANEKSNILAIYIALTNPKSTGKIKLKSSIFNIKPEIHAKYLSKDEDQETLMRGINYIIEMGKTNAFKDIGASILNLKFPSCKGSDTASDQYWKCYMKHMCSSGHQAVGTTKMGPSSDAFGVVDSTLKVKSVTGLRVVDAGVMPSIPSSNINAAVAMIAEKAADLIKEAWKGKENHSEL